MKCIRCNKDSNYKDRTNGTCPNCKGAFVFEPKNGDPITDMLFLNAINGVSGDGRIRWGVEHLYYEINRRWKRSRMPMGCIFILLVATAGLLGAAAINAAAVPNKPLPTTKKDPAATKTVSFALGGAVALMILTVGLVSRIPRPLVRMDLATFNRLWDRWRQVNGTPKGLIERMPEPEMPKDLEADIGDYSFDRAVICDRARTVDLLVANNFHFENNCAILSIEGYPKGPFKVIMAMLKRNPKLQIFVLHDATIPGCRLAQRLITEPEWFGGCGLRVIDLGLRPRHAGPFHGLLLEGPSIRPNDEIGIEQAEAEWLSKYKLELAAARPEQVLKRLFAGLMAHAADDPRAADSSGSVTTCGAFDAGGYGGADGDGGGGEGGADAFG
ncbi:MAG: hypothetical protein K8U57_29895 [Planctomycetes bacterium]|nr:hypothetical protein [Planctomycetota bacterium]